MTHRPLPHPHRISGTYETIPDPQYEHIGQHGNKNENKDEHNLPEKQQSPEKDMETSPTNTEATPTNSNIYNVLESESYDEPQETMTNQLVQYNTTAQDYEVPSNSGLTNSQENVTEK